MYTFNAETTKNELVSWLRDWFSENGPDCKAVIGISGGKDSSVCAALCAEALGKERVLGVLMPNGVQSDIADSRKLVSHLGIKSVTVDISYAYDAVLSGLFGEDVVPSEQTRINLPPRIRMTTLYAVSQSVNGRVINTCNLSEEYVGYSTRWGDSVGDVSPLANLTVQEVKAIGHALGLPPELVEKTPSDGLCGKSDEDKLGFPYEALDRYIRTGFCEEPYKKLIDSKHMKNLFKLRPIPSFFPGLEQHDVITPEEPYEREYTDKSQFVYAVTAVTEQPEFIDNYGEQALPNYNTLDVYRNEDDAHRERDRLEAEDERLAEEADTDRTQFFVEAWKVL